MMAETGERLIRRNLDSARSVVASWRAGNHAQHWARPALDEPPSATNMMYAAAYSAVARAADEQAAALLAYGFTPSHSAVTELRAIASRAAATATRTYAWANQLRDVELEDPA